MRFLKIFVVVMLVMTGGFLIWNLTLTGEYRASVEVSVKEDSDVIMDVVSDLETWPNWLHYLQVDTTVQIEFSENTVGERAWIRWSAPNSPDGRLEITEKLEYELKLLISIEEYPGAQGRITLIPREGGSDISISLSGKIPFYARFMSGTIEDILEQDLQKSLVDLNTILMEAR